jgi:branched-chain amino acid transport system substrate-binding protein
VLRSRTQALVIVLGLAALAGCTARGTSLSGARTTLPTTTTSAPARGNVDGVLRIGTLLPTTGVGAPLAPSLLAGVELAVEQINQAGGVNGRPVELVMADEGGDPAAAAVALEKLVDTEQVDAIIGPVSTRVTLSLLGAITSAGVIACSPTNTAIALSEYPDKDYYFRTAPPDSLQARALGQAIARTGALSTAILYVDDDYGRGMAEELANELRRQGNEVVARTAIDPNAADFTPAISSMLEREPEAIAYAGVTEPGARVIATLRQLGVRPSALPIFVTDGMRVSDLAAATAPNAPGIVAGVQGTSMAATGTGSRWFADALSEARPRVPNNYSSYAYDCVNLVALAAEAADSDEPSRLRAPMLEVSQGGADCRDFTVCVGPLRAGRNIDLDGASGQLDLRPNGDPGWGTFDLFVYDEAGHEVAQRQIVTDAS